MSFVSALSEVGQNVIIKLFSSFFYCLIDNIPVLLANCLWVAECPHVHKTTLFIEGTFK